MVLGVDDIATFPLEVEGPRLEHHAWFPERTNVEVIRVLDPHRLELRVWERGVGETQACGSGAVASAVAAVTSGRVSSPVTVEMPGGRVEVEVDDALAVELIGDGRAPVRRRARPLARGAARGRRVAVRFTRRLDRLPEYLAAPPTGGSPRRAPPAST